MKTNPAVSVIVPVYNVAPYIRRCLDSILAQTFTDFEVLLINDGSTDSSGDICDEYASNDSRLRVFHKENGGVSSARNVGIKNARGEYSIHVDPDDYVESNMLEEMYSECKKKKLDILVTNFYEDYTKKISLINLSLHNLSHTSLLDNIMYSYMGGSLWNKMIRHSLYSRNNILCDTRIHCSEDLMILLNLSEFFCSLGYLPKAYYHYCHRSTSIIRRRCSSGIIDDLTDLINVLEENKIQRAYLDYYINYKKFNVKMQCLRSGKFNKSKLKLIYPEIDPLIDSFRLDLLKKSLYLFGVNYSPRIAAFFFYIFQSCKRTVKIFK